MPASTAFELFPTQLLYPLTIPKFTAGTKPLFVRPTTGNNSATPKKCLKNL